MFGAVEWSSVTHAGAFVLGALLGTIATLRVMRVVFAVRRQERRADKDCGP